MSWIVDFILVLGGLIFFHELGHFLAARMLGIGVKTFHWASAQGWPVSHGEPPTTAFP